MELHTIFEALITAGFIAGALLAFGLLGLMQGVSRYSSVTQRERESEFLTREVVSAHIRRRDWRESFTGSLDEFNARDAA